MTELPDGTLPTIRDGRSALDAAPEAAPFPPRRPSPLSADRGRSIDGPPIRATGATELPCPVPSFNLGHVYRPRRPTLPRRDHLGL